MWTEPKCNKDNTMYICMGTRELTGVLYTVQVKVPHVQGKWHYPRGLALLRRTHPGLGHLCDPHLVPNEEGNMEKVSSAHPTIWAEILWDGNFLCLCTRNTYGKKEREDMRRGLCFLKYIRNNVGRWHHMLRSSEPKIHWCCHVKEEGRRTLYFWNMDSYFSVFPLFSLDILGNTHMSTVRESGSSQGFLHGDNVT